MLRKVEAGDPVMSVPSTNLCPQLTGAITLAAMPTAVRLARLFTRQHLLQWGLSQLIEDAELVTSELVTNAINATGTSNPSPRWGELSNLGLIRVRLAAVADSLIIEVWDRDPNPPMPTPPEQADEAGRGLLIIGALCRRWHYVLPESGGKAVWGELEIPAYDLVSARLPRRVRSQMAATNDTHTELCYETLKLSPTEAGA